VLRSALPFGLALAIAWPARSPAEVPRSVQLEYERGAEVAFCPDATAIRTGVAARLGYDPFQAQAEDRVHAAIRQVGRLLEARIELVDGHGQLKAQRRLVSHQHDCTELASSVELAIAIAIDPVVSAQKHSEQRPASPVKASGDTDGATARTGLARVETSSPVTAAADNHPRVKRLDIGLLVGLGAAPSANLGLRAGAALQGHVASLGLEARADLPAAKALRVGEVSSHLLVASLVPCAHVGMAAGCFLITAGVQRVAGDGLVHARQATVPYFGLGVRLGLALPIGARTDLAFHGDATAPLTNIKLKVDDTVVWTSPTIAVALGVGLAHRFP
jgi:hypothetical protein